MALIKSISGIRGIIGGKPGEGLTPVDIVKFTAAFGTWIKQDSPKIVIGRDARVSGEMVGHLVIGTLQGLGIDVIDVGLSPTPYLSESLFSRPSSHCFLVLSISSLPSLSSSFPRFQTLI